MTEQIRRFLDNLTFQQISKELEGFIEVISLYLRHDPEIFDDYNSRDDTKLKGRPFIVTKQGNIVSVSIGNWQLSEFDKRLLEGLTDLESALLSHNQIKEIPDEAFKDNKKLKSINLSVNQIKKLPDKLFEGLDELQTVDLTSNPLQLLPKSLFELPSVNWIALNDTKWDTVLINRDFIEKFKKTLHIH